MSNESQNLTTPATEPGTSIEKFKSAEERDNAYLELEKFSRTQSQRLADLEKKFETIQQPANQEHDNRSFTDLYPGQAQQPSNQETELASRLLTKPSEVLREHAQMVRQQTMREVQVYLANQALVNKFKQENPDLAKHEEIVGIFVGKQDEKLSPAERLKKAIPEARAYLASIATSNPAQAQLDPSTFVETPASGNAAPIVNPAPASDEDELSELIRERTAIRMKKRI
jgi:hypothetical protein